MLRSSDLIRGACSTTTGVYTPRVVRHVLQPGPWAGVILISCGDWYDDTGDDTDLENKVASAINNPTSQSLILLMTVFRSLGGSAAAACVTGSGAPESTRSTISSTSTAVIPASRRA